MKRIKIIASIFAILLCITLFFAWYIKGGFVPWSAGDYEYTYASDAKLHLEEFGFTNIELIPRDVKTLDEGPWATPVTQITIDGDTDFQERDRYNANVPIKIYHDQVIRKGAPLDSNNIQNYAPEVLVQMFKDAGFTNVHLTEHDDLDMDFMNELDDWDLFQYYRTHSATLPPYFNQITIDSKTHFELGEPLPMSAPVQITAHYQPNIRIVLIRLTYQESLNPITEPVRVCRNGELTSYWILEYGKDITLWMALDEEDPEALTLTFWREGSDWKSEELEYTVNKDLEVKLTLGSDMRILQEELSAVDENDRNMYLRIHMNHQ